MRLFSRPPNWKRHCENDAERHRDAGSNRVVSVRSGLDPVRVTAGFSALLDRDHTALLEAIDGRYGGVLDDVLAGRVPVVIAPAARMGRAAAHALIARGVQVVAFSDGDPALHGRLVDGLPVLSPDEIVHGHRGHAHLVASTLYDSVICERLRALGCDSVVPVGYLNHRLPEIFVSREYGGAFAAASDPANRQKIERAHALFDDAASRRVYREKIAFYLTFEKSRLDEIRSPEIMYFDRSVFRTTDEEAVVDGGAYSGDTLRTFLELTKKRFRSYAAFEPDEETFVKLQAIAATDPERIVTVRAGLGQESTLARLDSTHGLDARVLEPEELGGTPIPIVSLDDYFRQKPPPTLIKLDIEGSEAAALLGAKDLLRSASPALAISVYHHPADLWTLPLLMDRLVPGRRLVLRHYGREIDDTVCYSLPEGRA